MRRLPEAKTWIALFLTLGFFGLLVTEVARETPPDCLRRTEPLRQNLARLRTVLMSVERHFDSLHEVNESRQLVLMESVVTLLKEYLLPHLAAEEAVLYPAVDRELPGTKVTLTRVMSEEHAIMRRWIREMEDLANGSMPDHNAFTRRGERLLGLIEAHFEVDEAILFEVLDQAHPLSRAKAAERP